MKSMFLGAAVASIGLAASAASAGMSYSGGGGVFDAGNSTVISDIVITDSFSITDLTVTLDDLTHVWMGDLIATIENVETGTVVTLLDMIGGGAFGTTTDFGGTYSFNDAFTGDIWAEAALLGGDDTLPGGDYFPSDMTGAPTALSSFNGLDSAGTWRLTIIDTFPATEFGALGGWTLTVVPGPGAIALLGLAGLVGGRRRR